jgi:GPH family glycoside/pentoside/hexuronide:cation symporter
VTPADERSIPDPPERTTPARGERDAAKPAASIPLPRLLAYGGPMVGLSYLLFFVQFYFMKYVTDVLLLPPAVAGTLFALAKLWDAVSFPIVGSWSDRLESRLGRRRPFLLCALPPLVVGFVMLWNPPAAIPQAGWVGLGLLVFYSAFATYAVPHAALGAELSDSSSERTRLFGARQIFYTLGMLVAFVAIHRAMNSAAPRSAATALALPSALAAVALLVVTPLAIREQPPRERGGRLLAGLRDVFRDPVARLLLAVWFVENLGVGAVGTIAPFVAQYVLRRPDVVGSLSAAYVISGIVTIPLWVRLSRHFGARDTWLVAMLIGAAAFAGQLFVGAGDVLLTTALLVAAGCAMGCGSVLAFSLLADIIDLDEARTGLRREGIFSGAMMLMLKVGTSVAAAASGFVLDASGFVPNAEQSSASLLGLRILMGGLPSIGFLIGAALFVRFPLGRRPARG